MNTFYLLNHCVPSTAHSPCYLLTNTIYIAFNSGCKWINNRVYIQSRLDSGQPKSRNAFWCWRIFDRKIRRLTSNHLFHLVLIPRQVKLCIHCLLFFLYVKTFHPKGLNFAISTDHCLDFCTISQSELSRDVVETFFLQLFILNSNI